MENEGEKIKNKKGNEKW